MLRQIKLFSALVILSITLNLNKNSHVQAFNLFSFDMFNKPIGKLFDELFKWDPFSDKRVNDAQSEISKIGMNMGINEIMDPDFNATGRRHYNYGCNCENFTCSCYTHLEINKFKLNDTAHLNLTYLNKDYSLSLTFDIDDKVLYNETITVTNPPPMCFGLPYLEQTASLCLKLYKIDARNKSLSACADVIAKLDGVDVARIKIGCFRLGNGTKYNEQSTMSVGFNVGDSSVKYSYNDFSNQVNQIGNIGKSFIFESYDSLMNKIQDVKLPKINLEFDSNNLLNKIINPLKRTSNK